MTEPTTENEPERIKKLITIAGRDVWFYSLSEGQVFQLAHESRFLKTGANGDEERIIKSMDRVFRIFRSVMQDEADVEWLEDSLADGTISLTTIVEEAKSLMTETAKTEVKVRRGRARQR